MLQRIDGSEIIFFTWRTSLHDWLQQFIIT